MSADITFGYMINDSCLCFSGYDFGYMINDTCLRFSGYNFGCMINDTSLVAMILAA